MQGVNQPILSGKCPVNPHWNTRFKNYAFAGTLSEELRNAFRDAEALLQQSDLIKNSRSTTAGIFVVNGREFFIKRSNVNSFSERLRRIGRLSRAERNMQMAAELEKIGILTPKVYMALRTGAWFLPGASYLITDYFPGAMTVSDNLAELCATPEKWQKTVEGLTGIVLKMHQNGIEHGDLKLCNLMAVKQPGGDFRLGVFDLDGSVKRAAACSNKVRASDLARMISSTYIFMNKAQLAAPEDLSRIAALWTGSYRKAGGMDFYSDKYFRIKMRKFLPDVPALR